MRAWLQFCRLCDCVLGRMLAPDLSFISALWTQSELRERGGGDEGGLLLTATLAHWADAGVTEFD